MPEGLTKNEALRLIGNISDELFSLSQARPCIGAEIEFYLTGDNHNIKKLLDIVTDKYGKVEKEKGLGQYECVVNHTIELASLIDQIKSLKNFIETAASRNSVTALFNAKPFTEDYGSALHLHLSLHNSSGDNLFSAEKPEENGLLQYSIAGILDLTREGVYLLCAEDQEYQRYVSGFMAPTRICWEEITARL